MKLWSIILFAILLVSCTDYVNQIEDERDEWRTTREQAALLSSGEIVGLSSSIELKYSSSVVLSGDSHEESSSSDTKSCSSEKLSSSSKDGEPIDVSSSSSVNSKNSSSSAISNSDGSEETSSSSSVILSGDSHEESSSSENVKSSSSGKASWAYLNPAISYGEMIDNRDGQVYKTVVIGGQIWMAENLRYGKKVSNGSEIKDDAIVAYFCYDGDTIKCMKYGGLYSWSEMMALPYNCNNINCSDLIDGDGIHQGICPQDWHVPSLTEWDVLFTAVGGQSAAGKALKSSENWINNGDGLNTYGFSALPAGYASADGGQNFSEMSEAAFWTANIYSSYQAFYISFGYSGNGSHLTTYRGKVIGQSVRCIKNGSQMSNSSSSVSSSSGKASWTYLNPAISYGEMIDSRDGQVYKTVVIGEQTWMAENLNLETNNGSFCYNNEESYCAKYGRLYTWGVSMDSAGLYSDGGNGCGYIAECSPTYPVRGICPDGWHLPSKEEWDVILDKLKVDRESEKTLLSASELDCHCGSDKYGLSILGSAGRDYSGKNFGGTSRTAFFQTSSITSNTGTHSYTLYINAEVSNSNVYASMTDDWSRLYAFSVRCLKNSSNTVLISSSSTVAEVSSSSTSVVPPCKTTTEDNCEYGELKDDRDGKTYKTVKIGTQIWMAENLNYETNKSTCLDDEESNCLMYGRLYLWSDAMDSAGAYSMGGAGCGDGGSCSPITPVRGMCPKGWHIPDVTELGTLFASVGGGEMAGQQLKSSTSWPTGYKLCQNAGSNGSDSYGFGILPGGYQTNYGTFDHNYASFWSSTPFTVGNLSYYTYFSCLDDANYTNSPFKTSYKLSIRCLKD